MLRFIHAADIHLDSPLKGLEQYEGAPVDEIRGATRRALENLVELAIDREVDFLLIAGDLYDGDWKDHNTGLFFVAQMHRLREAGIPVVMISGNHDAANKMTRRLRLPDNVTLLPHTRPDTAGCVKLADLGVAVHGQSFRTAAVTDNLAAAYPQKRSGMFNIGLLHTALDGIDGHAPYAPCSLDHLRQKEYDYWALGHVHTRQICCEQSPIVFPGNVQGRHIRETGAKGCYLVTATAHGECDLEFLSLDVFRWEQCVVDAADAKRPECILQQFEDSLEKLARQHEGLPLAVRVEVSGTTKIHEALRADPHHWIQELRAAGLGCATSRVWIEKVRWRTSPQRNPENGEELSGPLATLREYLQELRADEAELTRLAAVLSDLQKKLPDELVRGEVGLGFGDVDQMRQWLDEVEPLLFSRLREGACG
jgi:DNA repair protein SbcD/Mre11